MKRRHRDSRSDSRSSSDDYREVRSRVARLSRFSSPLAKAMVQKAVNNLRRRVVLTPVRPRRLRNTPLSVSLAYVKQTPHRNRKEVVNCVKKNLSEFSDRIGSGAGRSRRRVDRQLSRRQLFQAARKSC